MPSHPKERHKAFMLVRQTLLYLPAQIAGPLAQLAAALVWTFWLTPEQLGGYALIWSIQELAGVLLISWWSAYVQRYASSFDDPGTWLRYERLEIIVQIASAIAQTAFAALAVMALFPATASLHLFLAIAAFTIARNGSAHFAVRARARNEALALTINVVSGALGGLVLGLAAMAYAKPNLELLLWAYAVAQILGLALSFQFMRIAVVRPALDRGMWNAAWGFGWPVAASSSMVWAAGHTIRFVVEVFAGRAAVGLMTVGWWLGLRLASFAGILVMGAAYNVVVERMRTEGPQAAREQLGVVALMLLGLLIPLCAGGSLLAQPLADHLAGDAYRDMTATILPAALIAGSLRVFQDSCVDAGFLVFEKPRYPMLIAAIDAATAAAGCGIGLYFGGIPGAAWGCAAGAMFTSLAGILAARSVFGMSINGLGLAKIAAATALMGLAISPFTEVATFMGLAGATILGAAIYSFAVLTMFPELRSALMRR
jgi:O-antigen/teichoic acid export membrane protein